MTTNADNCQNTISGNYCHVCGEKRFETGDLKFSRVITDITHSATDLDGKVLKSFKLLLLKPGQLTRDYLSGKRVSLLTPFRLFLFVNVFYFIVASLVGQNSFTTNLTVHMNANNFFHSEIAQHLVETHITTNNIELKDFSESFNDLQKIQAKVFIALMIPMLAFVVWLVSMKHNHAALTAWVFSTHVFSMALLMFIWVLPLVYYILAFAADITGLKLTNLASEWAMTSVLLGGIGLYAFVGFKKVYDSTFYINGLRAIVFVVGFYFALLSYRMLLFFITFYTV